MSLLYLACGDWNWNPPPTHTHTPLQCRWACDTSSHSSFRLQPADCSCAATPSVTLSGLTRLRYPSLKVPDSVGADCTHALLWHSVTDCAWVFDAGGCCWDFIAQHVCLPPFAIQMSAHEASCKAETALLASASHWRQSFQALASELNHFLSTAVEITSWVALPWYDVRNIFPRRHQHWTFHTICTHIRSGSLQ